MIGGSGIVACNNTTEVGRLCVIRPYCEVTTQCRTVDNRNQGRQTPSVPPQARSIDQPITQREGLKLNHFKKFSAIS